MKPKKSIIPKKTLTEVKKERGEILKDPNLSVKQKLEKIRQIKQ